MCVFLSSQAFHPHWSNTDACLSSILLHIIAKSSSTDHVLSHRSGLHLPRIFELLQCLPRLLGPLVVRWMKSGPIKSTT